MHSRQLGCRWWSENNNKKAISQKRRVARCDCGKYVETWLYSGASLGVGPALTPAVRRNAEILDPYKVARYFVSSTQILQKVH
jgi:hypothetical protein